MGIGAINLSWAMNLLDISASIKIALLEAPKSDINDVSAWNILSLKIN